MNEHLKRFIGQKIAISVTYYVKGQQEIEYIQGVFKDLENGDTYVIEQHIPYVNFLHGEETAIYERRFKVGEVTVLSNFKI